MRHQYKAWIVTAILMSAPALADPPPWAGSGKGNTDRAQGKGHSDRAQSKGRGQERSVQDSDRRQRSSERYFRDEHRVYVRDYYDQYHQRGKCPPGLAKKRNGCMPPGQAKKWQVGRPLPRDVVYYSVPTDLVIRLGEPRAGHRYVRVAADILLIAVGTGMVVDAIQDLGRM